MRIVSIGGGPAGLYFALLMKKADPGHDVTVVERNRADDTFGFGVVFSDATLDTFIEADRPTGEAITRAFAHWDDIDIHYQGQVLTSTGHGFSGMSRQALLDILQRRCAELGVALRFQTDVTDLTPYRDLQDFPLLQALVTKERSNSKPRRTAARERPAACGGRKATVRAYRGRYRLCSGAWVRAMLQARHSKICCSQR